MNALPNCDCLKNFGYNRLETLVYQTNYWWKKVQRESYFTLATSHEGYSLGKVVHEFEKSVYLWFLVSYLEALL